MIRTSVGAWGPSYWTRPRTALFKAKETEDWGDFIWHQISRTRYFTFQWTYALSLCIVSIFQHIKCFMDQAILKIENWENPCYLYFSVSESEHKVDVIWALIKLERNVLRKLLLWDASFLASLFQQWQRDLVMLHFWSWNRIPEELNDVLFIAIWLMLIESHKYISASVNTIDMSDFGEFFMAGPAAWLWWHTWNSSPRTLSGRAHKCICSVLSSLHRFFCKKISRLQT